MSHFIFKLYLLIIGLSLSRYGLLSRGCPSHCDVPLSHFKHGQLDTQASVACRSVTIVEALLFFTPLSQYCSR